MAVPNASGTGYLDAKQALIPAGNKISSTNQIDNNINALNPDDFLKQMMKKQRVNQKIV